MGGQLCEPGEGERQAFRPALQRQLEKFIALLEDRAEYFQSLQKPSLKAFFEVHAAKTDKELRFGKNFMLRCYPQLSQEQKDELAEWGTSRLTWQISSSGSKRHGMHSVARCAALFLMRSSTPRQRPRRPRRATLVTDGLPLRAAGRMQPRARTQKTQTALATERKKERKRERERERETEKQKEKEKERKRQREKKREREKQGAKDSSPNYNCSLL